MKDKHKSRITFYAAESMEFPDHWELHENLTLKEAVKAYQKILQKGTCCGPGIGFVLHDKKLPDYSSIHWPLYEDKICYSKINLVEAYREHPLVKQAIKEMEKYVSRLRKIKNNAGMER